MNVNYEENVPMESRRTLAERHDGLQADMKETASVLRKALEDLESHHIRIARLEEEVGLLPKKETR